MNDNSQNSRPGNDTKTCPICAETISIQAKKCIHCGEFLEGHKGWWWHTSLRFRPKTLWDLLSLLVIPGILILMGFLLNRMEVDRQAGLADARADASTATAGAVATEAFKATRTAEDIKATNTAAALQTAGAEATANAISARETLVAAQTANAMVAAETAKAISTAEAEATAKAIRAGEAKATADAISVQETIQAARAEGRATAEAEATATAVRVAETLAAARTAEAVREAEALAAAQTAQAVSATESARTFATAEAAATVSAAQTAEALATAQHAENIRATETAEATTATSTMARTPDRFIRDYYSAINDQLYEQTWEMLSDEFKVRHSFDEYVDWWDAVEKVDVLDVEIVEQSYDTAVINVLLHYLHKDGSKVESPNTFKLISDGKGSWLIIEQK